MKKWLKIIIITICIILISVILDLFFIFTFNKPLFSIKTDNDDSVNVVYKGIFYDVYNCVEFVYPLIKSKGTKFNCIINVEESKNDTMIIKKELF